MLTSGRNSDLATWSAAAAFLEVAMASWTCGLHASARPAASSAEWTGGAGGIGSSRTSIVPAGSPTRLLSCSAMSAACAVTWFNACFASIAATRISGERFAWESCSA